MDGPSRKFVADQGESGKENALPHVRGFAFGNDELALVRKAKAFEERIAACDGSDPIGPRYDYIAWLETHYPAKDKKKGLLYDEVFKFCRLVDSEPFNTPGSLNDHRYVDVWLLYATLSHEPLKIYDFMKTKGIGVRSALFYTDWAFELERIGKYSKAQATYKLGFDNLAEPRDDLESAFDAFVARRASCQSEEDAEPSEAERQVLNKLRPVGRQRLMAPVQRTGNNVLGPAGTVPSGEVASGSNARWDVRADGEENVNPYDAAVPAEEQEAEGETNVRFDELLKVEENRTDKIAFGSKVKVPGRRVGPKVPLADLKDRAAPAFSIFCEEPEPPRFGVDLKVPQAIRTGAPETDTHPAPQHAASQLPADGNDTVRQRMVYSGSVSVEERMAAAQLYADITGVPRAESRQHIARATSYEVGVWLWRTSRTHTAADLPENTVIHVPKEVFEGLSMEEVLLKKRKPC